VKNEVRGCNPKLAPATPLIHVLFFFFSACGSPAAARQTHILPLLCNTLPPGMSSPTKKEFGKDEININKNNNSFT
jgi:hypothetical protein